MKVSSWLIIITILFFHILSCSKSKSVTESKITGPPVVDSITPSSISGSNFHSEASVTFGNINVTNIERENAYKITAITPPSSIGTVDVVVSNPGGQSDRMTDGFDFFFALFGLPTIYDVSGPEALFSMDLDLDGDNDIISAGVSVLLNNGDGTFAPKIDYNAGSYTTDIFCSDFDNDSDVDLAVSNFKEDQISVLLNNGDGTFAPRVVYDVGESPWGIFGADLDSDGDDDLVVANPDWDHGITQESSKSTISVLLNNGDGTFASKVDYFAGTEARKVFIADLDSDGDNDLTVISDDYLLVLLNNGDGTFAEMAEYKMPYIGLFISCADLDDDGDYDVAVANKYAVSVLLNNGDGIFAPQVEFNISEGTGQRRNLIITDIDIDNDNDIIATGGFSKLSILMNKGNGTFDQWIDFEAGNKTRGLTAVDIDNDGDYDLAVGNDDPWYTVSVLLNQSK